MDICDIVALFAILINWIKFEWFRSVFYFGDYSKIHDMFWNKNGIFVGEYFSADKIIDRIQEKLEKNKQICLLFNSPGGMSRESRKLTRYLVNLRKSNILVYGIGWHSQISSAAIPVFFATSRRYLLGDTTMFFHNTQISFYRTEPYKIQCCCMNQRHEFKQRVRNQLVHPIEDMCKSKKDLSYKFDHKYVIDENIHKRECIIRLDSYIKVVLQGIPDDIRRWEEKCEGYRDSVIKATEGKIDDEKIKELCNKEITLNTQDLIDMGLVHRGILDFN